MRCPACEKPLVVVEVDQVELDVCAACEGKWFDAQELALLFEKTGQSEEIRSLERDLAALPPEPDAPRRRCPRCSARMKTVRMATAIPPVVLDLCPRADGIWFDRAELPRVLAAKIPESAPALERVKKFLGGFAAPPPS